MAVGCETAVLQYHLTVLKWNVGRLVVVGGRSSVVRALAAQASDLGSIPSDFLIFFTFHLACVSITIYLPGYIEPSKIQY